MNGVHDLQKLACSYNYMFQNFCVNATQMLAYFKFQVYLFTTFNIHNNNNYKLHKINEV